MIINDITFGKLEYDGYDWTKKEKEIYSFFGKNYEVNLKIIGRSFNSNEVIKQIQRDAYTYYKNSLEKINLLIEKTIHNFYQEECDEYRSMFGEEADLLAPIITDKKELGNLVELVSVFIGNEKDRVLIFIFDTTWDDEEGISVKINNEKIETIGGLSEMYI